ncbi:50S ribosomal protein L23 [Candidatus Saccharibacteria bacterium]|nr:50S ribosomal protein L23 [Candidatus Saccharibacteria bacterium]
MKDLVLKPRMSEKAYQQSVASNVYVFVVPLTVNKMTIKQAVEDQFEVTVTKVRTVIQSGKAVNSRHRRARPIKVNRADIKKAYVTVKDGDTITIFESEDEKDTKKKTTKKAKVAKAEK